MRQFLTLIILIILGITTYSSFILSRTDWVNGDVCPKILGIPACYIVFFCFFVGLISFLCKPPYSTYMFFSFIGCIFLIASYGSIWEVFGFAKCPRTSTGIPMCYISLSITTVLIILNFIRLQMKVN